MTKFTFGLLALALSTSSAFAQDYLNCGFRIGDNDPDCPFLGSCPQKELKVSKSQLFLEVNEGDRLEGRINLKKVLVLDKKDNEKKDVKITIFADDERVEMLKKEKKLNAITYDTQNGFDYTIQKHGDTFDILFNSSVYNLNITLTGNARYSAIMGTSDNVVNVTCERLNKDIYQEFKAKKAALDAHKKAKKVGQGGASKQ